MFLYKSKIRTIIITNITKCFQTRTYKGVCMKLNAKIIGERLRALRKEKGYNQTELTRILEEEYYINHKRAYIGRIERGEDKALLDLPLLEALSDIFNCDIGYLIGEIEEHTQENKYICDRLNISEKAADNIKACCQGENKDIFNALCENDNLFNVVVPAIQECINVVVSNSTVEYRILFEAEKLDEEQLSILENKANEMAAEYNNKAVEFSYIDAGIYKLSVESTQIYKNIIEEVSEPIIKANNKKYEEYAKSLGINV